MALLNVVRRALLWSGACAGGVLILIMTVARPVQAAEGVTIVSQTVNCDSIGVTYTVVGAVAEESAALTAYQGSVPVGSATGPGYPDGTYSVTIPISPPQPEGTSMYVLISVGAASDEGAYTPCSGGGGGPSSSNPGSGGPAENWEGYTDGRLNPDPGEYYSVWCVFDRVEVWRGVPEAELLKQIPLADVASLSVGGTLDLGDFMTLVRHSEDTVTIYGSNGNAAPEPGSKAFSLSECVARNGGLPEPPAGDGEVAAGSEEGSGDHSTAGATYSSLSVIDVILFLCPSATFMLMGVLSVPAVARRRGNRPASGGPGHRGNRPPS